MQDKITQVVDHIQVRCLWQFFSRSWDREENIEGVLTKTCDLLTGATPGTGTDFDRCHLADARILVVELRTGLPWIADMSPEDIRTMIAGVKERMRVIAITGSRNEELNVQNY